MSFLPIASLQIKKTYMLVILDTELCETCITPNFLVQIKSYRHGSFSFDWKTISMNGGILPIHLFDYFDEDYGLTWGLTQLV